MTRDDKFKFDIPNFQKILKSFEGYSPLHISVISNDLESVKYLLEETNIDVTELTINEESVVHLACKTAVAIEILEKILLSLREVMSVD